MSSVLTTLLTRKRAEKKAFNDTVDVLKEIYKRRTVKEDDMLETLHELYADSEEEKRYRCATSPPPPTRPSASLLLYADFEFFHVDK